MDYYVKNAKIWQGENRFARELIVRGGVIAMLGQEQALAPFAEGCQVLDCGGQTVIPGFFDACLCPDAAFADMPSGIRRLAEGLSRRAQRFPRTAKRGAIVYWDSAGEVLTRPMLDGLWSISPLMLVDLRRDCAWTNQSADDWFERRGAQQELHTETGLLQGSLWRQAARLMPLPELSEWMEEWQQCLRRTAQLGVTSLQTPSLTWLPSGVLGAAELLCGSEQGLTRLQLIRPGGERCGTQLFGWEEGFGGQLTALSQLPHQIRRGGQPLIPAVTQKQLADVLAQLETQPLAAFPLRRPTLIGGELTDRSQLQRMGKLGIGTVGFPLLREETLRSARNQGLDPAVCCAYRTLNGLGAHVAFGGAYRCAPFDLLQQAVCRTDGEGREALTAAEALTIFTRGGAWTAFQEDSLGVLRCGYAADLVVLDRDVFSCPPEELSRIRPICTMVGGILSYAAM